MQIRKIIFRLLICVLCVFCLHTVSFAADNLPPGDIGDYGNWLTPDNMETFNSNIIEDMTAFQEKFQTEVNKPTFVPVEVKIGLVFMKALSAIDYVLQISLVRFTIIFLLIMYAFWVALEAYKLIHESKDYKPVLYNIFKKGFTIVIWIIVLHFGPTKIFTTIITPIIALGTYLSNFILNAVAQTYNIDIPDTCATIQNYVAQHNANGKILVDSETAANIMCLPGRLSTYFYHATASAWKWMLYGFGHSFTAICIGAVCMVMFIKCIFKYAFMTLGIVASLFLTLLMLPFTAIAESMPEAPEKNYAGQIFSGFLKIFNTKKLSDVFAVFINTAIYFVSLSIMISICAALLNNIVSINGESEYALASGITTILCGSLILYLTNKATDLAKEMGGSIDNSFGENLSKDSKKLLGDAKGFGTKLFKGWLKG